MSQCKHGEPLFGHCAECDLARSAPESAQIMNWRADNPDEIRARARAQSPAKDAREVPDELARQWFREALEQPSIVKHIIDRFVAWDRQHRAQQVKYNAFISPEGLICTHELGSDNVQIFFDSPDDLSRLIDILSALRVGAKIRNLDFDAWLEKSQFIHKGPKGSRVVWVHELRDYLADKRLIPAYQNGSANQVQSTQAMQEESNAKA